MIGGRKRERDLDNGEKVHEKRFVFFQLSHSLESKFLDLDLQLVSFLSINTGVFKNQIKVKPFSYYLIVVWYLDLMFF